KCTIIGWSEDRLLDQITSLYRERPASRPRYWVDRRDVSACREWLSGLGATIEQPPQSDACGRHPARTTRRHDALGDVGVPFSSIPRCRIGGMARGGRCYTKHRRLVV